MHYQAPLTLEQSLLSLKDDYLTKTKVKFDMPAPSSFAKFSGHKDIKTRQRQIQLLQAIATLPIPSHTIDTKNAYIEKMRLMVAACYLIKQQIIAQNKVTPVYSELNKLLNNALQISAHNQLDTETLKNCLLVFEKYAPEKINAHFDKRKMPPTEWEDLITFSRNQRIALLPDTDSPIATNLSFITGVIFHPMGWGIGFALGQTLGKAGQTGVVKNVVTTTLTSALVLLGPVTGSSTAAATFFARPISEQAVEFGVGYATAQFCGYGFKKIGQGAGWVIGKGLELAIDTGVKITNKTVNYINSDKVIELNIKIGIDLVYGELIAKSNALSEEDALQKIQALVCDNSSNQKSGIESQANVLPFQLSEQEELLLPDVLTILGNRQNTKPIEEILEMDEEEEAPALTT